MAGAISPQFPEYIGTATRLNNGQVLIAGGTTFHSHHATELASAELYTP